MVQQPMVMVQQPVMAPTIAEESQPAAASSVAVFVDGVFNPESASVLIDVWDNVADVDD